MEILALMVLWAIGGAIKEGLAAAGRGYQNAAAAASRGTQGMRKSSNRGTRVAGGLLQGLGALVGGAVAGGVGGAKALKRGAQNGWVQGREIGEKRQRERAERREREAEKREAEKREAEKREAETTDDDGSDTGDGAPELVAAEEPENQADRPSVRSDPPVATTPPEDPWWGPAPPSGFPRPPRAVPPDGPSPDLPPREPYGPPGTAQRIYTPGNGVPMSTPTGEVQNYTQSRNAAAAYRSKAATFLDTGGDLLDSIDEALTALRGAQRDFTAAGLGDSTMSAIAAAIEKLETMQRTELISMTDACVSRAKQLDAALETHQGIYEANLSNTDGGDREFHGGAASPNAA